MKVNSEIDILKKVIVHQPDLGIEKVTPQFAEELLYDDIVYLPRMLEEHKVFTNTLKTFIGDENVIEFEDLLIDICQNHEVVQEIVDELQAFFQLSEHGANALLALSAHDFARACIVGWNVKFEFGSEKNDRLLPLPNLIFTRDIGVAVNDHFIVCRANKAARLRESLLTSKIVKHHELFKEKRAKNQIIDLYESFKPNVGGKLKSVEGGDIMIIDSNNLFIGCSERSTELGIKDLIQQLFEKKIVSKITVVYIPNERYCMHLDTIFTVISEEFCVGYAPLVFEENDSVKILQYHESIDNFVPLTSLKDAIESVYPNIVCIPCGGGVSPYDAREQWTDGSNLVAIKKNVAFAYDRNYHTAEAFEDLGFKIKSASYLFDRYQQKTNALQKISKTLITLPSSELSRARGGSHCMTLPLERS